MKNLLHPIDWPRSLEVRYQDPVINSTIAWGSFKGKGDLYRKLMPAQFSICSYCETVLSRDEQSIGYHIEHIELKSGNPSVTFKFDNLMISCFTNGYEISASNLDTNPISCGHAERKKNQINLSLFIKPTLQNCERYFFYELDGRVVPHSKLTSIDSAKAEYTIETLNLNCRRLTRLREEMIVEGHKIVDELLDDEEALSNFIELELAVINNKHFSFITTRRQFFQPLL